MSEAPAHQDADVEEPATRRKHEDSAEPTTLQSAISLLHLPPSFGHALSSCTRR